MTDISNQFTGIDYMLIHLANMYGKDKELFEDRISWAKWALEQDLEDLAPNADEPNQFLQCWREIHRVREGHPTGLMVEMDKQVSL